MKNLKLRMDGEITVSPKMLQTLIKLGIAQNKEWILGYLSKSLFGAEMLTAKEVEASMKISRSMLGRWEAKGWIKPVRLGCSKRYPKDELLKLRKYGR